VLATNRHRCVEMQQDAEEEKPLPTIVQAWLLESLNDLERTAGMAVRST